VKTVVDSSALIASLNDDDAHNDAATDLLGAARAEGAVVVNDVVYAELSARFGEHETLRAFLSDTGLRRESLDEDTLYLAGTRYREYLDNRPDGLACHRCGHETNYPCESCGASIRSRQYIAADFLIGAHAECEADRLLTFDEGFFDTYFQVDTMTVAGR
jgi:hypothetical protein